MQNAAREGSDFASHHPECALSFYLWRLFWATVYLFIKYMLGSIVVAIFCGGHAVYSVLTSPKKLWSMWSGVEFVKLRFYK
jgi:hypothetical protein